MKKIFRNLLYIFGFYFIFVLILSIFNYIGLISDKLCMYLNFIMFILILYFNGNRECVRKCKNKLFYGVILGLTIDFIFFIISLILHKFNMRSIIYYLIILLVSILSTYRKKNLQ